MATMRFCLLASTALAAATAVAVPAFAQESEDTGGLGEIIVTAQKREQNLQDVPIAVTALAGDALAANRVVNVVDLSSMAPGVTVRPAPGGLASAAFTIRGAFSTGIVPGMDKQVSMYIDGVYLASPRGSLFDLPNIERIEVLRGPQGTLFGRNATAGAVSVATQDPMGEGHMKASVSVGNYDTKRYELTAHTPELGPLSGYFSYVKDKHRGYVHNGLIQEFDRTTNDLLGNGRDFRSAEWLGGKDSDSVFAAVKFESGDFKAVYKYDRNDTKGTPDAIALTGYDWSIPGAQGTILNPVLQNIYDAAVAHGMPVATNHKRPDEVWNSYSGYQDQKSFGHNLTINYQLNDHISLKNIAAYRESSVESTTGLFGANAVPVYPEAAVLPSYPANSTLCTACVGQDTRAKQWSNELQVNYDSDFLTLTVGGLYFKSKDWTTETGLQNTVIFTRSLPAGNVIPFLPGVIYNEAESTAVYAQGEFHLTPQLDLVLGGRYTHDKKLNQVSSLTEATCPLRPPMGETSDYYVTCYRENGLTTTSGRYKDNNFNYLIGLNYTLDDGTLLYAKWSTAFVSGGTMATIEFKPEKSKSAEAGVKTDLFNRRLRVNLAGYWAEYKNYQTSLGVTIIPEPEPIDNRVYSALSNIVINQGTAKVHGVELEVTAAPVDGVVVGGNLSYSKTKYSDVPDILYTWQGFPAGSDPLNPYAAFSDSDYRPLARPKWTGSVFAQYTSQPIWGDARFTARVQGNYQSTSITAAYKDIETYYPDANYITSIPGYWVFNGRIALQDIPVGNFKGTLALWGRNLTDNKSVAFPVNQFGTSAATFIEPRRYGLDFTVEF